MIISLREFRLHIPSTHLCSSDDHLDQADCSLDAQSSEMEGDLSPEGPCKKKRHSVSSASDRGSSPLMISPDQIKKEKKDPDAEPVRPTQEITEGLQFLTAAGDKLKAEKRTIISAFVYFHRYLTQVKSDSSQEYTQRLLIQDIIAATCYSLSKKVNEDSNFNVNDVINVFYVMNNPTAHPLDPSDIEMTKFRDTLAEFELELLHKIKFNLNVEIPHYYLLNYLKYLTDLSTATRSRNAAYNEATCKILDDFYYNPNCIKYKAKDIAISVLMFMMKTVPLELKPNEQTSHLHWVGFFSGSTDNFTLYREIELEIIRAYSLV